MVKKKEPQTVTVDGVQYDATTFSEKQILLFNHCIDLDKKIASANFLLTQLNVGKESFIKMLREELASFETPNNVQ